MIPEYLIPRLEWNRKSHKKISSYRFESKSIAKLNWPIKNMIYIFCDKKSCLVNRCYCFSHHIQINTWKSSRVDPQKMCFELYTKYAEKVHGAQLRYLNRIQIPLCMMELIHSFSRQRSKIYGFLVCQWKYDQPRGCLKVRRWWSISGLHGITSCSLGSRT